MRSSRPLSPTSASTIKMNVASRISFGTMRRPKPRRRGGTAGWFDEGSGVVRMSAWVVYAATLCLSIPGSVYPRTCLSRPVYPAFYPEGQPQRARMDATSVVIVLTTLPADADASVLARQLIGERLAACVNALPV